jgi:RimJ/RimL family protein N-acetyltransferase
MDFSKFLELKTDDLILKKISDTDRLFIETMFSDKDVRKYYIVPKEAQQDYRKLINYWLHDISNGAGYAWIIYQKGSGLFSSDKPCGFIAFEFRDSLKNARISYALKPEYRKKGIISKSAEFIISELKSLGVETLEADIDKDNTDSENLIVKLGFTANKRAALVDPDMMRDGDIRLRFLWRKELFDYSELDFFVLNQQSFSRIINNRTIFKIWEEETSDGPDFGFMSFINQRKPTGKYHFALATDVTEKLVGISEDETLYNITWELLREESHKGKKFLVFCGWGEQMSTGIFGGLPQFNNYEIGFEKAIFANLIANLISNKPDFFSISKMRNVIGLEGFKFENGQVRI